MLYPFPNVIGVGYRFHVADCRVGLSAEYLAPGYAGPQQWTPGGSLGPDIFKAHRIVGFKRLQLDTTFIFCLESPDILPLEFFDGLICPGVNNGAPLLTANASVWLNVYGTTFTNWRWEGIAPGDPVDGDLIIF